MKRLDDYIDVLTDLYGPMYWAGENEGWDEYHQGTATGFDSDSANIVIAEDGQISVDGKGGVRFRFSNPARSWQHGNESD